MVELESQGQLTDRANLATRAKLAVTKLRHPQKVSPQLVCGPSCWLKRHTGSPRRPPLPPGPSPLPFIGSLIAMIKNRPTLKWIDRMMDEMNTNILCFRIGQTHIITVSDPKIACEILKDNDGIFSSRPDCVSGYLVSGGYLSTILAPANDHWKKMKKMLVMEVLSVARHKWLQNKRDPEAHNILRYIYNECETNVNITRGILNVRSIVLQHSCNISRKIIFGSRYFGQGSENGGPGYEEIEHVDSFLTVHAYVYAFCVTDYFPWLRWITDFDGHEKIMRRSLQTARKYQDSLIDERLQQWNDGVRTKEEDLLDVFINLKNPKLTSNQIKAQILDLMLATFDNTSNAVEWAMAEMINQPRIFKKAIQEIDSVVGKDRLVQEFDTPKLNYIKACLREAFRLHPVASFNLPHVSSVDTTVAGYLIPKGSHVLLSRRGLGRNSDVWNESMTFIPERHMNGDNEVVLADHDLHMFSFSTGRCGCPGVLLGTTMTVMLMARLVQGFTWELPPNEPHVDLNENVHNLWKAKPLFALAKTRLPRHLYPALKLDVKLGICIIWTSLICSATLGDQVTTDVASLFLLDDEGSRSNPDMAIEVSDLLSVDQLLESVMKSAQQVSRISICNAPNMSFEMSNHFKQRQQWHVNGVQSAGQSFMEQSTAPTTSKRVSNDGADSDAVIVSWSNHRSNGVMARYQANGIVVDELTNREFDQLQLSRVRDHLV
ncbi:valine N-monooxygenase 1-like [Rutidosis leptorrhynchoides]|uniref:valine N-monooxygenase 1-like n=1 Tax=Rutidosis leptorrhynchoides TaxID=125765 RepID=UPI003A991CDD